MIKTRSHIRVTEEIKLPGIFLKKKKGGGNGIGTIPRTIEKIKTI